MLPRTRVEWVLASWRKESKGKVEGQSNQAKMKEWSGVV